MTEIIYKIDIPITGIISLRKKGNELIKISEPIEYYNYPHTMKYEHILTEEILRQLGHIDLTIKDKKLQQDTIKSQLIEGMKKGLKITIDEKNYIFYWGGE